MPKAKGKSRGVNGKAKGSQFERVVCKTLSLWVSDGKRDDLFWRSAMSGGRATVGFAKGIDRTSQAGDISSIDSEGHEFIKRFVVECKNVKSLKLEDVFLYGHTGVGLYQYWVKLLRECSNVRKLPILIGKSLRRPPVIAIDDKVAQHIKVLPHNVGHIKSSVLGVEVFQYDDFMSKVSYSELIRAADIVLSTYRIRLKVDK